MPANGGAFTVMFNCAVSGAHGPVPSTRYVHVPCGSKPGMNVELCCTRKGSYHVPFSEGAPPSESVMVKAPSVSQMKIERELPGCGAGVSVATTIAVSATQGGPP